jgi:galactokinase/mevalonate kinase-like predicted kinase
LRLGIAGGDTDISRYADDRRRHTQVTGDRHAYAFVTGRTDRRVSFTAVDIGVMELISLDEIDCEAATLVLHKGVHDRFVRDFLNGERVPLSVTTVDASAGSRLGSSSALVPWSRRSANISTFRSTDTMSPIWRAI